MSWLGDFGKDFAFARELCGGSRTQALASYGTWAVLVYRFGRMAAGCRFAPLRWLLLVPYHLARIAVELALGISIARTAELGVPVMFHHFGGVFIAGGVVVGRRCQIFHGVTMGERGGRHAGRPRLGDDVLVGAGAKLLGPLAIGSGARIGANAVVLVDVPPGAVASGVPAVVVERGALAR